MVMRVKDIQDAIDRGQFDEAHGALEELLRLGPKNLEALKKKAALFSFEGKFSEEGAVWRKILEVDPEDKEAVDYFHRSFIEEREKERPTKRRKEWRWG